jgi:hypothetical protein
MGYYPIVVPYGTQGIIILTMVNQDTNTLNVYNYSSGNNNWTGTIVFW